MHLVTSQFSELMWMCLVCVHSVTLLKPVMFSNLQLNSKGLMHVWLKIFVSTNLKWSYIIEQDLKDTAVIKCILFVISQMPLNLLDYSSECTGLNYMVRVSLHSPISTLSTKWQKDTGSKWTLVSHLLCRFLTYLLTWAITTATALIWSITVVRRIYWKLDI